MRLLMVIMSLLAGLFLLSGGITTVKKAVEDRNAAIAAIEQ